jgi:hypothetical protein
MSVAGDGTIPVCCTRYDVEDGYATFFRNFNEQHCVTPQTMKFLFTDGRLTKEGIQRKFKITRLLDFDRGPAFYTEFLRRVRRLLATANVVPSSPILVTRMMEALRSSETSVRTRATRRHNREDGILHIPRRENLKSYKDVTWIFISQKTAFFVVTAVKTNLT